MPAIKSKSAMPCQIVWLSISSWVGISIGAIHVYGKLIWKDTEHRDLDLDHPMSGKDAAYYNKQMQARGYHSLKRKPGDASKDFDTRESVVVSAKKKAHELWRGDCLMILGDGGSASAHPVLMWPTRFAAQAARANALADEWTKINGYEGAHADRADEIDAEWYALIQSMGNPSTY